MTLTFPRFKVPVMNVNTTILSGRTHHRGQDRELYKEDDKKLAFVTLRREARLTIVPLLDGNVDSVIPNLQVYRMWHQSRINRILS